MRKFFFSLLVSSALLSATQAQNYYSAGEFGVSLGASQYFGDLNDEYGLKTPNPAIAAFGRYHLNPYISLRANLLYTHVGYADNLSSNPYNRQRNLSFQSNIYEASVQAEFNFFRYHTGEINSRFTPYLTGGVGAFYYNPYAFYNDKKYFLRPLGTEGQQAEVGQGKSYSRISMCFPVGAGIKYWIRPGINLGVEIANRLTLTDYMDDVSTNYAGSEYFATDPRNPNPAYILQDRSVEVDPNNTLGRRGKQRGNSSTKDQYMMVLINLSFQLKAYKCPAYMSNVLEYY
ncbi:MAG TPA: DUF6089 family protein [Flavipsychrobacter sp.]|nr:DUF6089 family protein [Flavipsychrobacter sp.]